MLIGSMGPLSFRGFVAAMGPASVVALALSGLLRDLYFSRAVRRAPSADAAQAPERAAEPRALLVLALVVAGFFVH
jgi:Na+/H+ antiporter NhaD/arsenite permease-like protein